MRGHVRKRGNRWAAVVFLGFDEKGKRKYKWYSGYDTKKAAERALTEKLQEINTGVFVDVQKQTVGKYMQSWLADKKQQVRPGTFRSYEWLVEKHVIPNVGKLDMSKLKPTHLQELYTTLQNAEPPLSPRSVLHLHRILHQALDRAVKWGLLVRNVTDAVEPPRPKQDEMKIWDEAQLETFLTASNTSRYHMAFVLLASTGMRPGELLALQWDKVDFETGKIHVVRAYSYTGKGYKIEEPKTDSGRRPIDLPQSVINLLRKHKTYQNEERLQAGKNYEPNNLVICTGNGTPVLQHNLRTTFDRIVKNSKLPRIRMYDLRHTHASILLKKGVHPKIVQERLGHSDITLTLNTYSHLIPGLQAAAANAVDSIFEGLQFNAEYED